MNLMQHPETLDRIAASYALGTLRGGARRRFETMARVQAPVRAAALVWQTRLAAMTELQEQAAPDPAVWTRIHNLVQADQQALHMQAARGASAPFPVARLTRSNRVRLTRSRLAITPGGVGSSRSLRSMKLRS